MSIKTILATAFAMLMMVNISTAMADDHETSSSSNSGYSDSSDSSDNETTTTARTVCRCGVAIVKNQLEKDKEKADVEAKKADDEAKTADQHYEDVKNSEHSSEEALQKAKDNKDLKDEKAKEADAHAKEADDAESNEESAQRSQYGSCVCPNGTKSYNVPAAGAASSASTPPTSTKAFREVRGQ